MSKVRVCQCARACACVRVHYARPMCVLDVTRVVWG